MDRQARKLQIAREQQGYNDSGSSLPNSIELSEGKSSLLQNDTASTAEEGLPSGGNRISDLTLLSDDDDCVFVVIFLAQCTSIVTITSLW